MDLIDFTQPLLLISAASIIFNPTWWNIVARREYKTHWITKLFGGPYRGCYALALAIFTLGILRDILFDYALKEQPKLQIIDETLATLIGYGFISFGSVLVLSSYYRLGITGTYLGDYFGILMKERVTGFPFSFMDNPMYNGSTFCFFGYSIQSQCPAGFLLTLLVFLVYQIASIYFEK